jgi:hypothetical protein
MQSAHVVALKSGQQNDEAGRVPHPFASQKGATVFLDGAD